MQQQVKMNPWTDWLNGLPHVVSGVATQPLSAIAVIGLTLLENILPSGGMVVALRVVATVFTVKIIYAVTVDAMCDTNVKPADPKALMQLLILNLQFAVSSSILALLFVIPGVIWALRSSLAINFLCLGMNEPDSIKASRELTNGKLKKVAKYLLPVPIVLFSIAFLTGVASGCIEPSTKNTSMNWVFANLPYVSLTYLADLFGCFIQLSILPLQARLYELLTSSETAPDATPTMRHSLIT